MVSPVCNCLALTPHETEKLLLRRLPSSTIAVPETRTREVIAMITRYFSGEAIDFTTVELDLAGQERFFLDVYAVARQIGWGRTTTYGGIVKDLGLGMEKARDVGQAMAKNPVPLIIPCHRVLAAAWQARRLLRTGRNHHQIAHARS